MTTAYTLTGIFPPGGAANVGPFLMPPGSDNLDFTQSLNIYIVGATLPGTAVGSAISAGSDQPAFSLAFVNNGIGPPFLVAQVTVDKGSVYSADPNVRSNMAKAFKLFRAQLEALETGNAATLLPGGSATIASRTAAAMPLRLDEILTYYYALDTAAQSIDLAAGMSLRIDWSGYQYCDPPGGTGAGLNGFANSGSSRYEIVQRPDGTLAFDAFSGLFAPGFATSPAGSCPFYAAGPLDLQLIGNGRRHLRLIWPAQFSAPGSLDNAAVSGQLSCRLIGADTYADLEAATLDVLAGNSGCGTQGSGSQPIVSIVFTGRVTAVPEIGVWMNGALARVPVGTTVRNFAQCTADPAPGQMAASSTGNVLSNLQLSAMRWFQATPTMAPSDPTMTSYASALIELVGADQVTGPAGGGLDVPLVKGDMLSINLNPSTS